MDAIERELQRQREAGRARAARFRRHRDTDATRAEENYCADDDVGLARLEGKARALRASGKPVPPALQEALEDGRALLLSRASRRTPL